MTTWGVRPKYYLIGPFRVATSLQHEILRSRVELSELDLAENWNEKDTLTQYSMKMF